MISDSGGGGGGGGGGMLCLGDIFLHRSRPEMSQILVGGKKLWPNAFTHDMYHKADVYLFTRWQMLLYN